MDRSCENEYKLFNNNNNNNNNIIIIIIIIYCN